MLKDGHAVARSSDFMMYAVEAEFIDRVITEYGPCRLFILALSIDFGSTPLT